MNRAHSWMYFRQRRAERVFWNLVSTLVVLSFLGLAAFIALAMR